MSHPQRQNPVQSSNQCLTGCLYQVIQATGLPGSNVLKLLPIVKPKDNPVPVMPFPVTPSASTLNVPQTVMSSPTPVSIVSRPSPVRVPMVQTPALGNYIIAAQNNFTNAFHIDNPFSVSQETTLFLDNAQLALPTNSVPGNPTIIMMHKKLASPVKPPPVLPPGQSLQIPAPAEVISVPASSLPFSIQQKILPQSSGTDIGKIPSVIYVSPVNTVKANNNRSSLLYPSPGSSSITPGTKSPLGPKPPSSVSDAPKGPMKWVVQENKEAAACLVPVKSSSDTASKILQILSKTKMEGVNLPNSGQSTVMQVKDNALVMCNNKIFFFTKKGTELIDKGSKNPEPPQYSSPEKAAPQTEPMKDFSNRVVQVVLCKNKSPPPSTEQPAPSNVVPTVKPKRKSSTPRANRGDPSVIYIPDDDEAGCRKASVKAEDTPCSLSNPARTSTVNAADKGDSVKKTVQDRETPAAMETTTALATGFASRPTSHSLGAVCFHPALNADSALLPGSEDSEIIPAAKASEVNGMDDGSWRLKFGLVKKEKIILKRLPVIQAQSTSQSKSCPQDPVETQLKRKSCSIQTVNDSKKHKSAEGSDLRPISVPADVPPDSPSSSPVSRSSAVPGGRNPSPVPRDSETTETSRSIWSPLYYRGEASHPPDSADFQVNQDTTEHFSEASLPRFHIDSFSSMYSDETTKDEKIQRLKEVLKEREKALEALRHQNTA